MLTLFDPLRRNTDTRGLSAHVASLASLETNGQPRKLPVLDTLVDAWNKTENVPVVGLSPAHRRRHRAPC